MKTEFRSGLLWTPPALTGYKMFSWGYNRFGELGQGVSTYAISSPVQVGALNTWVKMSTGWNSMSALRNDGAEFVWAENDTGCLGLGNTTFYSSPVQLGASGTWTRVSMGTVDTTAGVAGGKMFVWANNNNGQLGNGTLVPATVSSPTQVGAATDWTDGRACSQFVHGIRNGGRLYGWGENDWGQLGIGYYVPPGHGASSPVQVGTLTTWAKVFDAKNLTTVAMQTDGSLWGWGMARYGLLLRPTIPNRIPSPVQLGYGKTFREVAVGQYHMAGITTDGKLWAWGGNNYGGLGQGDDISRSSPVQVGVASNWTKVGAGQDWTAAVNTAGKLYTWGKNTYGRLGQGDTAHRYVPTQIGTLTTWRDVFCGIYTGFALSL